MGIGYPQNMTQGPMEDEPCFKILCLLKTFFSLLLTPNKKLNLNVLQGMKKPLKFLINGQGPHKFRLYNIEKG